MFQRRTYPRMLGWFIHQKKMECVVYINVVVKVNLTLTTSSLKSQCILTVAFIANEFTQYVTRLVNKP